MPGTDEYERAKARVMRSPKLRPLAFYILQDFGEADHYKWVWSAKVSEIADWAQEIADNHAEARRQAEEEAT